ncbi:hypothetical protein BpHYR1_025538 [Brachionus plicatilis]|uniref:Uncharacterized protein n=1 Tax=Brachionus plicatilis TaxID=10195 RepID=A0A3M7SMF5_BRAPC|nr:hypothetical protein BpHYR1_025538 [Brachionus plicatilis]
MNSQMPLRVSLFLDDCSMDMVIRAMRALFIVSELDSSSSLHTELVVLAFVFAFTTTVCQIRQINTIKPKIDKEKKDRWMDGQRCMTRVICALIVAATHKRFLCCVVLS